jgi:hypothetical protein
MESGRTPIRIKPSLLRFIIFNLKTAKYAEFDAKNAKAIYSAFFARLYFAYSAVK